MPSMRSTGDCFGNALVESFWCRVQVELLDRCRWRARRELANALLEHLEIFHDQHPMGALGWLTLAEFEDQAAITVAAIPAIRLHWSRDTRASIRPGRSGTLLRLGVLPNAVKAESEEKSTCTDAKDGYCQGGSESVSISRSSGISCSTTSGGISSLQEAHLPDTSTSWGACSTIH